MEDQLASYENMKDPGDDFNKKNELSPCHNSKVTDTDQHTHLCDGFSSIINYINRNAF